MTPEWEGKKCEEQERQIGLFKSFGLKAIGRKSFTTKKIIFRQGLEREREIDFILFVHPEYGPSRK